MDEEAFAKVIAEGRSMQQRFPELEGVAVGGTAAALHCRHRFSLDVDLVTPHLKDVYPEVADALEHWDGWKTNRTNPPLLILGKRHGVELGLRQQRRAVPLQIVRTDGLVISSGAETLRVKAFLLQERRATRDYIDVAALAEHLGQSEAIKALGYLNLLYSQGTSQSTVTRLAEAVEASPLDLAETDLSVYKGLRAPFTDWSYVSGACRRLGRELLKLELGNRLPSTLDEGFYETHPK